MVVGATVVTMRAVVVGATVVTILDVVGAGVVAGPNTPVPITKSIVASSNL